MIDGFVLAMILINRKPDEFYHQAVKKGKGIILRFVGAQAAICKSISSESPWIAGEARSLLPKQSPNYWTEQYGCELKFE